MDRKLELLAKVPLFTHVDRKGVEQIGHIANEVGVPAGKVVAAQGSHGVEFFIILDGHVSVEHDGRHLTDLGPGDFFGEMALLADQPTIQGAILDAVAARWAATEASHPS